MERILVSVLLSFMLVGVTLSEPAPDSKETPIPFPGIEQEHINCTGVHNILDQYCHTHKCKNLFTNYCYNDVNGKPPSKLITVKAG
jgi:hypothetical protein